MKKLIVSGLAACALVTGMPAQAQFFNRIFGTASNQDQREWREGEFDVVRLESAESGAKNDHPAQLTPGDIQASLQRLRITGRKGSTALFTAEEAAILARGVASALAKAKPSEDLLFVSVGAYGEGVFAPKFGNSGRIFYANGQLNVILGETHVDFVGTYRATRMLHTFQFGSRATPASSALLAADNVSFHEGRKDWTVLSVAPAPAVTASPAKAQAATSNEPGASAMPRASEPSNAEVRLTTLKHLFEKGLITEEEYKAKRREILEKL